MDILKRKEDALKQDAEVVLKPDKEGAMDAELVEDLKKEEELEEEEKEKKEVEDKLEEELDKIFYVIKNYSTRFTNYFIF